MFNRHDISRNACQLFGGQARCGYDWWWHSFTGRHAVTGEEKPFFIEFFVCNPAHGGERPKFGQLGGIPSYLMVKAGAWGEDAAQLHRFFSWKEAKVAMTVPYSVEAADCYVDEQRTCGTVTVPAEGAAAHPEWMCQSGEMSWNLKIDKKVAFNVGYGAGSLFRKLQLFAMF